MNVSALIPIFVGLALAPLFRSAINKTKAAFAGRKGQPWLQPYRDLRKLMAKGIVKGNPTSWLFHLGPIVNLSCVLLALCFVPFWGQVSFMSFAGDLIFLIGLTGLARIFMVLAALDTGSPFHAMGASREVWLGAVFEPLSLLSILALTNTSSNLSFSGLVNGYLGTYWQHSPVVILAILLAIFVTLLAENSRIPFDDPTTHLELTMIHEVMVLDHSGPDLAYIEYGRAVKLWLTSQFLVGIILAAFEFHSVLTPLAAIMLTFSVAGFIGIVESTLARLPMLRLHYAASTAGAAVILAMVLREVLS